MSFNGGNIKRKGAISIFLLIFIILTILSLVLSLLINPIWWILLPISLLSLVLLKMMSNYFWLEKKTCPKCNAPITKYNDYCRNCGYKLWFKCISCGRYISSRTQFCEKCNIELQHTVEETESFDDDLSKEGTPLPIKNNYCPNCGSKLRSDLNLRFCEECGQKL